MTPQQRSRNTQCCPAQAVYLPLELRNNAFPKDTAARACRQQEQLRHVQCVEYQRHDALRSGTSYGGGMAGSQYRSRTRREALRKAIKEKHVSHASIWGRRTIAPSSFTVAERLAGYATAAAPKDTAIIDPIPRVVPRWPTAAKQRATCEAHCITMLPRSQPHPGVRQRALRVWLPLSTEEEARA